MFTCSSLANLIFAFGIFKRIECGLCSSRELGNKSCEMGCSQTKPPSDSGGFFVFVF